MSVKLFIWLEGNWVPARGPGLNYWSIIVTRSTSWLIILTFWVTISNLEVPSSRVFSFYPIFCRQSILVSSLRYLFYALVSEKSSLSLLFCFWISSICKFDMLRLFWLSIVNAFITFWHHEWLKAWDLLFIRLIRSWLPREIDILSFYDFLLATHCLSHNRDFK